MLGWVTGRVTAGLRITGLRLRAGEDPATPLEECEAKVAAGCGQVHRDSVSFPSRASSQA